MRELGRPTPMRSFGQDVGADEASVQQFACDRKLDPAAYLRCLHIDYIVDEGEVSSCQDMA